MKKIYIRYKLSDQEKQKLQDTFKEVEFVYEDDKECEAIIGFLSPDTLLNYPNLKWFQSTAVGVDRYIKKGVLKDDVILTNAVGVHTKEVAQHTLAMILALLKNLDYYRDNQNQHLWKDEGKLKSIDDLKVTIVGLGDIGNALARKLKALGMYVIGVKRKVIEKPEYIDELYTSEDLKTAISLADIVVTILPGNLSNKHLFDLDTFRCMKKDAIFINVGRGNLYKEETLIQALDEGLIAKAGLDVFEKEPLDPNSKLWNYKNVLITPHVAGNYHLQDAHDKFLQLIYENIRRYLNNEKLLYIVEERE